MVPGVLGLKCMLSLIIILNVNKMGKDETTFNLKKLEDGIKKLKENKILSKNEPTVFIRIFPQFSFEFLF